MKLEEFIKLINYFDSILWDTKVDETNWYYNGLVLDYYFEDSVLSIDYLNLEDYFDSFLIFKYIDTEQLSEQFKELSEAKRLKLVEAILNIFKFSTYDKEISKTVFDKSTRFLKRNDIEFKNPENGLLQLSNNDIFDQGSYCVIIKVENGIVKKELKPLYKDNLEFQKRMKYEFENMYKLRDSAQILKVFSYDHENFSYLMERANENLYDYLKKEVEIPFEQKLKIIYDVLNGMSYAHKNHIIHRDLHLGNILKINNDFVICDFGLSKDESIERSLKSSASKKIIICF
ncbi:protein kinase domain-containing protein [Paracerasibacillus soli]|uniref:Protein kinase n=1 Tax=Paracerasibacillus soli TaxID=480284 RepID=A0ABU5CRP9_9BACI|nr:protein kinase [Virgibacillus soli]MDY0409033.1 protein kinase [Virgibacillus soli]